MSIEKVSNRVRGLDKSALELITKLEHERLVVGKTLELLLSLRGQYELRGFLTEGQRALVRKIAKEHGVTR